MPRSGDEACLCTDVDYNLLSVLASMSLKLQVIGVNGPAGGVASAKPSDHEEAATGMLKPHVSEELAGLCGKGNGSDDNIGAAGSAGTAGVSGGLVGRSKLL